MSVQSFQETIALVVDEHLDNGLLQAEFYSIMIDESTDISIDHTLVIYLCYVLGGEIRCTLYILVTFAEALAVIRSLAFFLPSALFQKVRPRFFWEVDDIAIQSHHN